MFGRSNGSWSVTPHGTDGSLHDSVFRLFVEQKPSDLACGDLTLFGIIKHEKVICIVQRNDAAVRHVSAKQRDVLGPENLSHRYILSSVCTRDHRPVLLPGLCRTPRQTRAQVRSPFGTQGARRSHLAGWPLAKALLAGAGGPRLRCHGGARSRSRHQGTRALKSALGTCPRTVSSRHRQRSAQSGLRVRFASRLRIL